MTLDNVLSNLIFSNFYTGKHSLAVWLAIAFMAATAKVEKSSLVKPFS